MNYQNPRYIPHIFLMEFETSGLIHLILYSMKSSTPRMIKLPLSFILRQNLHEIALLSHNPIKSAVLSPDSPILSFFLVFLQ